MDVYCYTCENCHWQYAKSILVNANQHFVHFNWAPEGKKENFLFPKDVAWMSVRNELKKRGEKGIWGESKFSYGRFFSSSFTRFVGTRISWAPQIEFLFFPSVPRARRTRANIFNSLSLSFFPSLHRCTFFFLFFSTLLETTCRAVDLLRERPRLRAGWARPEYVNHSREQKLARASTPA